MLADDTLLWRLLRFLDHADCLEVPANYQHRRTMARFNQLAQRLDRDFGRQCEVDRQVQDASFHGRIDIPATATGTLRRLVIVISNFGNLAVIAVDNPGVWTDKEAAQLLHPEDDTRIRRALADLTYTLIPEEPLWQRYNGAWTPDNRPARVDTWWDRYFDYL
ncbi:hypothetical protein ACFP2T_05580 [Plantactinospora solaniradicis]|uniref:Uncharacterized protein n=1 Tax=Plantactinospora solaniradicis TaxID=1723736 RepID=A0ABW1K308_9ACTN